MFLESWKVELAIILLIIADLAIIAVECSVEYNVICIKGVVTPENAVRSLGDAQATETAHLQQMVNGWPPPLARLAQTGAVPAKSLLQVSWSGITEEVSSAAPSQLHLMDGVTAASAALGGDPHGSASPEVLVCESPHGPTGHAVVHQCHLWSIIILCIFEVEICLKMWVDPHHFWKSKMHVLDFFVVTLSLFFDIAMPFIIKSIKSLDQNEAKAGSDILAMVLILPRLWRVARVFHGIFESVNKGYGHVQGLKEELKKAREKIAELEGDTSHPPSDKH
jgi:hypothetical protein